ncbi:MAG: F0F1 ATP synthase subunit alpha [Candidatus Paceibacterota bacterium]
MERDITQAPAKIRKKNIGSVTEVKDEVVFIDGLDEAAYGELLDFGSGVKGIAIDLTDEGVGAIVFGEYERITEGSRVTGSGEVLSVPVGEKYIGRVVNGMGEVIDGGPSIQSRTRAFVDKIAPGVVARQPVDTPVQTGIKAIDALIPIGRGQRELIIGDRRTGKTTLAIDTILSQADQDMICIYCAVGQRRANTATIINLLETKGAMKYSIVVSASASDPASMQYIAPYVACTIGEYFMDKGRDVLVIYDDLSKHAWAYRQISLVLRRPAGREAYPGDVFYLHSRLLVRACLLSKKNGGGSLTALPIIETQEGDVSAYIPTNVISITDGQIVLESDLFNAGVRPAINVGASVSRVGGAAQTKAIKQVAGKLKLSLAQYRELAAFAQLESDLDKETATMIDRGSRMTELLKQAKHQPYNLSAQTVLFWAGIKGYLDSLTVDKVVIFEEAFLTFMKSQHKTVLSHIDKSKVLNESTEKKLEKIVSQFMQSKFPKKEE